MVSRGSTILAGVVFALGLGAGPASAALPQGNLLQNPGAETFQDWIPGTGLVTAVPYGLPTLLFPSAAQGAALGGGQRFFAGGEPDTSHGDPSVATLTQTYTIPASARPDVASGMALATIGGCLGGSYLDDDSAYLNVDFRFGPDGDRAGPSFGVAGPKAAERGNATGFLPKAESTTVPEATEQIVVTLEFHRVTGSGTYNNGLADNLVLELTPASAPPPTVSCPVPTTVGDGSGGGGGGGSGGGGGGGTGGGGGDPAGKFPLLQRSHSARVSGSRIGVPLTCDSDDARCVGRLALTVRGLPHAASLKLSPTRFSIAPATTKTVRVRLGRKARRRLAALSKRQLRRLRLTAKVTVGSRTATFRLRLKS